MNMTFEDALQKVAENHNCENFNTLCAFNERLEVKYTREAATLWNQSLIDRIAFLERLSENFGTKERELKVKITEQSDRIKELEAELDLCRESNVSWPALDL